jgi:adenylate cyclase
VVAGTGALNVPITQDRDMTDALRSFVAGRVGARLGEVDERLAGERRLVTAMFADVSGFTRLADQLETEQLLEIIDPVITRLANVVGPFEGYVEKFAGDALLALFGAPIAHEDDAERAVLAALGMQRELERMREQVPGAKDLTLHVGINTGHGIARMLRSEVRTDYAVLGDSVILAQRLESAAPSGETYVSESTYQVTRHRFEFEFVGELTLKGKSQAARAWRLIGERSAGDQVALRGRAASRPLIGRERELVELREVVDSVTSGLGGALVAVTGEPGIGKSRLTEDVRSFAQAHGVRWLESRCLSYGAGLPYWPYAELVRHLAGLGLDQAPPDAAQRLAETLAKVGATEALPFFARLLGLPSDDPDVTGLEPEAFRRGLHAAFASLIATLSRETPLVLEIEDLHWADASSIALTRELAPLTNGRFVLYLTGRPEAEALIPEAQRRHVIALTPLDEHAVTSLMESILQGHAPTRLVPFVIERTGGNPFFVEELTHSLRETKAIHLDDGMWIMRAGWDAKQLPPTLEGVLASRIDLLPLSTADVLGSAAVIGRRVRLPLLRAIAHDPADVDQALPELTRSGFLDPGDDDHTLVFHHALIQDIAYSRLLRKTSRELHRKVASAAEELYGSADDVVDLLARHLYLGEAGAKAIEYLIRAGERARRLFANQEAIEHLAHAVEVARKEHQLVESLPPVLLDLAELNELVGDYDQAFGLYEEVRATTNDVRAWRGMGSSLRRRGRFAEALALMREAFRSDALKDQDLLPLKLEEAWNLNGSGRQDEAVSTLRSALAAAESRRDVVVGQLLLQLARREAEIGELDAALAHALDARAVLEERHDLKGLATATRVVGGAHYRLGHLDEAADILRRGLRLAEQVGSVEEIGASLINLGMVELKRGSLDEAIACDRRAIEEFERIGHQTGRANAFANLAEKLMHRGDYSEALHYCEKAIDLARSIGYSLWLGDATQTRSAIEERQGRYRDAAASAEDAASIYVGIGAGPRATEAFKLAADAWEKAGENERARDIRSRAPSLSSSA